ncbi:Crp/Fnr family transcriptional regulator [Membranihabitans marinus]|uniref:Crp/Fnr family transcriptional regulator n=1 Tax=Membranihabitans marinus TaxID=1227546 RepID=UPI001F2F30BA|nr:Crp/Fnr family transcriptional regulator [Membranihabitans marinus]
MYFILISDVDLFFDTIVRTMDKIYDFLQSITSIDEATIEALKPLFKRKELKKNQNFIEAGVKAKKIAFLESGILRAYYRNDEGQEYNKHFFIPPCFIGGYSSLVSGKTNQIIQQALTDCVIWEANYSALVQLYGEHRDLERMSRILSEQFFVQKEQREVEIVLLNADKRYEIFKREWPDLEQIIPQYHIASYLGISPTQLSRIRRASMKK